MIIRGERDSETFINPELVKLAHYDNGGRLWITFLDSKEHMCIRMDYEQSRIAIAKIEAYIENGVS